MSIKMDYTKYNLRCNRSISEKMMKKDFIYDIRPPQAMLQKYAETKTPVALSFPVSEKNNYNRQLNNDTDEFMYRERRLLGFKCNFCHEQIATLSSLSTHVKSHLKKYCKKCYWILEDNETIEQHNYYNHQILSSGSMIFSSTITSLH